MNIEAATYFSISTENTKGKLATINAALLEKNVCLKAIWGFGTTEGQAEVVVVPNDVSEFKAATKNIGWKMHEGGCFWITGDDSTGALVGVMKKIADEGLAILALDAVAMDGKFGCYLLAADHDYAAIAEVLGVRVAMV